MFFFPEVIAIIFIDKLIIFMIENYKGWDITLTWDEKNYLTNDFANINFYNQKEKWQGVNLDGNKIYGSSLKEIRHMIDYPGLHN